METVSEIDEKDFVKFLTDLGVETYDLPFGWRINDCDDFGILRWIYQQLDHNNALTAREAYRYADLERNNQLLPPDELEDTITSLMGQYPGLTLPGDKFALEQVRQQNKFLKERINCLNKQERLTEGLIKQNEIAKEELSDEICQLSDQLVRIQVDEETATSACTNLAQEIEENLETLALTVAENLAVYTNFHTDQDIAGNFLVSGPIDAYMQNRRQFKSHFKLYTSKRFAFNCNDSFISDGNIDGSEIMAARKVEKRLHDSISAYIDSVADLNAVHQKIVVASNYQDIHPSQIPMATTACLSAVELLRHDIQVLRQTLEGATRHFVEQQTLHAATTKARAALAHRKEIHEDLCTLHTRVLNASSLDSLLYWALRRQSGRVEELVEFSRDVRDFLLERRSSIASRIESMNTITQEQILYERESEHSNILLDTLCDLYNVKEMDINALANQIDYIDKGIGVVKEDLHGIIVKKEDFLRHNANKTQSLKNFIWDGCTKQPNSWDRSLASMMHALRTEMLVLEQSVVESAKQFTVVKSKDKDLGRRLWQLFLANPEKLIEKIEELRLKALPRKAFATKT